MEELPKEKITPRPSRSAEIDEMVDKEYVKQTEILDDLAKQLEKEKAESALEKEEIEKRYRAATGKKE